MRLSRFLHVSLAMLASIFATVLSTVERVAVAIFQTVSAPLKLSIDSILPPLSLAGSSTAIEPSLFTSNRHEAAVSRRSAARNI